MNKCACSQWLPMHTGREIGLSWSKTTKHSVCSQCFSAKKQSEGWEAQNRLHKSKEIKTQMYRQHYKIIDPYKLHAYLTSGQNAGHARELPCMQMCSKESAPLGRRIQNTANIKHEQSSATTTTNSTLYANKKYVRPRHMLPCIFSHL